jgi:hypothetical protein
VQGLSHASLSAGLLVRAPLCGKLTSDVIVFRWQVESYCDAIAKFTGLSFTKLYLVKGLHEEGSN